MKIVTSKLAHESKMYLHASKRIKALFNTVLVLIAVLLFGPLALKAQAPNGESADSTSGTTSGLLIPQNDGPGLRSVLTAEQMARFADYSVADGLIRLPGMQKNMNGQLNLRGVGYDQFYVTVDGQRLGTGGMGVRSLDLSSISADMIQQIEVVKVLTPAMDADGLGGAINLKTRAPQNQRSLQLRAGGAASTQYLSRTGPGIQLWGHYADSLGEGVSLSVTLSHQLDERGRDQLGMNYLTTDLGNGPVDVLESVSPGIQADGRQRYGGNLQLNFNPTNRDSYQLRATLNFDDRTTVLHDDSWHANGDWFNQDSTGAVGEMGTYWENARRSESKTSMFAFRFNGENEFDQFNLSYDLGWAQTQVKSRYYLFPFRIAELNHAINTDDRLHPTMTITNRGNQILDDGSVDRRFMEGQNFDRTLQDYKHNRFSAHADIEFPFDFGNVNVGASGRINIKDGDTNRNSFEYSRTLRLINFDMLREPLRDIEVFNSDYTIPWLVNTKHAKAFMESQLPVFQGNDSLRKSSNIRNYTATEDIFAGYAMAKFHFGNFSFLGGLRAEMTNATYEGQQILFDQAGDFSSSSDTKETTDYVNIFPNAQLKFEPDTRSSLLLAYSRTIGRPDFYQLAPYKLRFDEDSTLYEGNSNLDPMVSDNFDIHAEHRFGRTGWISVGGFYKQLSDFIYLQNSTISSGPDAGYTVQTFENGDQTATLYGVELSVRQGLVFLPGELGNLSVFGNYTYTQSSYDTPYRTDVDLPGQRPHVVNAALEYTGGRFAAQVSYHWAAKSLENLKDERRVAASLGNNKVYMDQYQDGLVSLSATLRYKLSSHFTFWADAYDLMQKEQVQYEESRKYYPNMIYYQDGFNFKVGVRYAL